MIEIIMEVEKRFGITMETRDMDHIHCVGDLVIRISDKIAARAANWSNAVDIGSRPARRISKRANWIRAGLTPAPIQSPVFAPQRDVSHGLGRGEAPNQGAYVESRRLCSTHSANPLAVLFPCVHIRRQCPCTNFAYINILAS